MHYHKITKFLDQWLPEHGNAFANQKIELKIRARVLLGLYIANIIIMIVSFLVFLGLHLFGHHDFSVALSLIAVMALLLFMQVLMFYKLGNVGASAIIFSMTFFGATLIVLIVTGGWASPVRQLFFCAPMISFLVGGRQEGIYNSVLVLLIGLLMLVANRIGFQIFQIIKPENIDIVAAIIWIISINLLIACLAVYDAVLEDFSQMHTRSR